MGSPELLSDSRKWPNRQYRRFKLPAYGVAICCILIYMQLCIFPSYLTSAKPSSHKLSKLHVEQVADGLKRCAAAMSPKVLYSTPEAFSRSNPRWNPISGQNCSVLLFNATLFNGEITLKDHVNILFTKGLIESVEITSATVPNTNSGRLVIDMKGKFVTPGLVDMHSHHLVYSYPVVSTTLDGNEMNPEFGPLTPFVRSLDSMRFDTATKLIASGGITSSLVLPGSANIMGGEAFLVKNIVNGGENSEEVVEDMLLEHGIDRHNRRRYMKMACGENPSEEYHHSRMGNAWKLRKHMAKAQEFLRKQDDWCLSAAAAYENNDSAAIHSLAASVGDSGLSAEMLEMDSTIGMLRGKVGVNIHCYEPEDMEDMILHSKEFGFQIQAFHHALSAWKIPEMIKSTGYNITVATFAELGLYKMEANEANLWAGKLLSDHGIPVAYKSDHGVTNAKFLMFAAAQAHSFHLPEDLALQSITSVPATSLEIDHRIGYVKPGYDADIVIWNTHPLSIGATPLQVYIDGRATLDIDTSESTDPKNAEARSPTTQSRMRKVVSEETKDQVCQDLNNPLREFIITGITKSFVGSPQLTTSSKVEHVLILQNGTITCFGPKGTCRTSNKDSESTVIELQDGYILPGLTATANTLGLADIPVLEETMDGTVSSSVDVTNSENVEFAKYGVHLDGKSFKRARYGGVTKAIARPISSKGLLIGVSTGIRTSGRRTKLNGGVFQDDVAIHFRIGQGSKASPTPTISSAVKLLRKILFENRGKNNVYGRAANGTLPVVIHADNKYDIIEMIQLKEELGDIKMIIFGAAEAHSVAAEIATAKIPLILAPLRCAPEQWEALDCLSGSPLTNSSARVLSDAGVTFGLGFGPRDSDSQIQSLILEASWAAKSAGLSEQTAVDLVSRRIEDMFGLRLEGDADTTIGDFVIYEGNPLEFGASVVLSVEESDGGIVDCYPGVQ